MPDISPAAEHLLSALAADPIDRERILTWASCGFSCAAAARARRDLGSRRAFQRTIRRYEQSLAEALRTFLAHCDTSG